MYFAEYLPRVNCVTVVLDFGGEPITKINKVPDVNPPILELVTNEKTYNIRIPVKTDGDVQLTNVKKVSDKSLMLNVKLSGEKGREEGFMGQQVRWSCKDLMNKTPKVDKSNRFNFQCSKCKNVIIDSENFKFQDMPSEFWYELMDFWHCHKPHNDQPTEKNYNGFLKPKSDDTVIIGNHSLLFNQNDNVIVDNNISCNNCRNVLGDYYQNTCRVLKWNIKLEYQVSGNTIQEEFPTHVFFYNLLLDKINSLAARKFRLLYHEKSWYIWVMNIGLNISINDTIQNNALKLLFYSDDGDNLEYDDYEPIDVSPELLQQFTEKLLEINSLLPTNCSTLTMKDKTYKISYLSQEG